MLEYLAAGAASGVASSIVQGDMNRTLQAQQYRNQRALNEQGFKLGQLAQRQSVPNLVESAKRAGMSPLAVLGQSFTPAVSSGGEAAGASASAPNFDFVSALAAEEQVKNMRLQNDLLEREVNKGKDADNSFVISYRETLEREKSDLQKQMSESHGTNAQELQTRINDIDASLEKLKDPNYRATVGILEGYKAGAETAKKSFEIVNNFLEGKLNKDVLVKKLGNGTADILSSVPKYERDELRARIDSIRQVIAESESKEKLNDQTVLKLQADITALGQQVLRANLNDPNFLKYMFGKDSEEYKNWSETDFREKAYQVGTAVVSSVAGGGSIAVLNHGLRMIERNKVEELPQNTNPHPAGYQGNSPFPNAYGN